MGWLKEMGCEMTKAAIVVLPEMTERQMRECISAAYCAGAKQVEIWSICHEAKWLKNMPVQTVRIIGDQKGEKAEADAYVTLLKQLYDEVMPNLILLGADNRSEELVARLCYRVAGSCALNITGMTRQKERLSITRRIMGLQLEGEFLFQKMPYLITIHQGAFPEIQKNGVPECIRLAWKPPQPDWCAKKVEKIQEERNMENDLLVLVGGRGLGDRHSAEKLCQLGRALGAGVGGTRPAVLNGWLPMSHLIGLSGNKVSPEVCVVFGASGCMPFIGGISKNTVIIAINNDPHALIFQYSDMGIVADCNEVIKALANLQAKEQRHDR